MGGRLATLSTGRKVTYAALALITAQVALRGWLVGHSWFLVDDFLFLSDIARNQDTVEWYFRIHQGHFMPFSFVLAKIVGEIGAFNWTAAAVQIIVLQLLASLTCWWMLRTLFGNRPAILVPLAFYAFSPLTMPSVMWWAVAINQLPHHIASFGAIAAHVMFLRSTRWKPALLASAFLSLGFLSYTKTVLLPVVLVLLTLMYFSRGSLPRRCYKSLRKYWKAWLAYSVVTTSWLGAYVYSNQDSVGGPRSSFLELASTSVLESFGTTLVGGPWTWSDFGAGPISFAAAPDLGIVASWLLISSSIVFIWATKERALRALGLVGFYLSVSVAIIYLGRGYIVTLLGGASVGRQVQYLSDSAPVVVLTIGLLLVPLTGAVEPIRRRKRPILTWRPHPTLLTIVAAGLITGSVYSSIEVARPWSTNYIERSFTQAASHNIVRDEPLFADVAIPDSVLFPLFAPRNLIRNYFAPLGTAVHTTNTGNDLKLFREDGSVVRAVPEGPIRTEVDPESSCQFEVSKEARTIPIVPIANYPLWMAIEYTSNMDATIPLEFGIYRKQVPIENGKHTLFLSTTGAYDSVTLRPLVGQKICVDNIKVGQLVAAAKP